MDKKPMECGSMGMMMGNGNSARVLSDPLERLKREHVILNEKMSQFHSLAESIGQDLNLNIYDELIRLRVLVSEFFAELSSHSAKEEDTLFPMMERYIGRDVGPIAVMEYEHKQAHQHLQNCLESTQNIQATVGIEEAKAIAVHAIQAYSVLSTHFMKEDNILFPMADNMLSLEEKELLGQRI